MLYAALQLLICGQSHSLCVEFSLKDVLSAAATIGNIQPDYISILKDGRHPLPTSLLCKCFARCFETLPRSLYLRHKVDRADLTIGIKCAFLSSHVDCGAERGRGWYGGGGRPAQQPHGHAGGGVLDRAVPHRRAGVLHDGSRALNTKLFNVNGSAYISFYCGCGLVYR